ncbi:MAG: GGDEF domain-containing protein, partial [Nitrospiraceae bacterium]|nr:GGDEF domain-containing protein [Nitrospiraceae bacterium]
MAEFSARLQRLIREKSRLRDLQNLAFADALTGLPNRKMFLDRAQQALAQGKRYHHVLAFLFLDVDNFKTINDTYGHDAGDQVLKEVATRLSGSLRKADTVARISGDEFIVLTIVSGLEDAGVFASRILGIFAAPFCFGQQNVSVSC